nr:efflux RND transporter periplasmic adaptor subunit [Rhodovulum sp. P5]
MIRPQNLYAVTAGLLLAFLLPLSVTAQQRTGAPPPNVSVQTVALQDVILSYDYAARVSAFRDVEVRARVGGILLHRNFAEGAQVAAGDVLFEIDPAPYEVALAKAEAELQQAEAQHDQAVRDLERAENLFKQSVGSEKTRDDAIATEALTRAAVAAAEASVRSAELNLGYTRVTAPIGGVTSTEEVSEGSLIGTDASSSLLTEITVLDPVHVNFAFSDKELAEIRSLLDASAARGGTIDRIEVTVSLGDGTPYGQTGTLDFTSSSLDEETGTLKARAVVANPDRQLLPGQFVRATIESPLQDAILIPRIAVMQGPHGAFVYVLVDGTAEVRPVTLGKTAAARVVITSGLEPGDRVITDGIVKVRPGAPVTPVEQVAEADQ